MTMRAKAAPGPCLEPLFEIGRGGVAVVRAERMTRADGTQSVVAVKRMMPLVAGDPKTRDMFFSEARLAAMIHHPRVVRILDVGLEDDPFIVMELVLGESLSSLIACARARGEPPLEPRLAAWVIAETCEALHAAHELRDPTSGQPLQLVHRDVSPQNILLGFDGTVRLTDFGIAKALGFGSRTRTGEVKGKLPYMSPEQVMCEPMDRRSDLFSVGAVLFELTTGRRMWGEGNEVDVLRKLASEPVPGLEDGGPELAALHGALTARAAEDRPAMALDAAQSLRTFSKLDAAQASGMLRDRMHHLFPDRMGDLSRLLGARKPSGIARSNRKTGAILLAAVILAALAMAVPLTNRRLGASPPVPQPSAPHSSSVIVPEPVVAHPSAAPAQQPSASASAPPRSAPPPRKTTSASSPVPKTSAPVRTDKLDEHPF